MSYPASEQIYVLKIIELMQEVGGYWYIEQSEDNNLCIRCCPFGYPEVIRKRVYDVKEFYNELKDAIYKQDKEQETDISLLPTHTYTKKMGGKR